MDHATPPTLTPGWFPDPLRRYELRYHNGERWTGDVSVEGRRFVDPLGAAPAGGPASGPAPTQPRHPARLPGVLGFVCGLLAVTLAWMPILFVAGAAFAVAGVVLGWISLRRGRDAPADADTAHGFALAGVGAAPIALGLCVVGVLLTRSVLHQWDDYAHPGPYELRPGACALHAGLASFDGTLVNHDDRTRRYVLSIAYRDQDRDLVTTSVTIGPLGPGEQGTWHDEHFVGNADLRCDVTDVNGPFPFGLDQNG